MAGRAQFPSPATPKAVIFDIGRVIVRLDLERALAPLRLGGNGELRSTERIWTAILEDPRWVDWQEGRMMPREWHAHITERLGVSLGFEEFCEAWIRALDPETILSEALFERLAARCRLALLSNTDPVHAAYLERHFTFVRHFPVRTYSNVVGASKPSPTIYRAALKALGVAAPEALYIDDVAEYAEAARLVGMDAIRFESAAQLQGELSRRGLVDR